MKIIDFFRGIKRGWITGKNGGILDSMWCSHCGIKQPVYMDKDVLRCAACGKIITGADEIVIDV